MYGRLNVNDDPFSQWVCDALNTQLQTPANHDLRPTQIVAAISSSNQQLQQIDTCWGIKPAWAKKLLINAQAETVATKPSFRQAFTKHRCVVPCSGFYEWQGSNQNVGKKQKWLFEHVNQQPLYMAGIFYPALDKHNDTLQLVTLTTQPSAAFTQYHHRFPQFIHQADVASFLYGDSEQALRIMLGNDDQHIIVKPQP